MSALRDTSAAEAQQRRLEVVVMQLLEAFGARGHAFYFSVVDADKWDHLQVWAMGARRSIEVGKVGAADVLHIDIGGDVRMMVGESMLHHFDARAPQFGEETRRIADTGDGMNAPTGKAAQWLALSAIDQRDGDFPDQLHRHLAGVRLAAVADAEIDRCQAR